MGEKTYELCLRLQKLLLVTRLFQLGLVALLAYLFGLFLATLQRLDLHGRTAVVTSTPIRGNQLSQTS